MNLPSFNVIWSFLGATLAMVSLLLSLAVLSQPSEGSWGGFAVFVLNLPLSLVPLLLGYILGFNQVPLMIASGMIQWYFVGWLIEIAIRRYRSRSPR